MAAKKAPAKAKKPVAEYTLHTPFSHKVLKRDWEDVEDLNKDLQLQIWKDRGRDPEGVNRSNSSGTWHSKDGLFERLGDSGQVIKGMFGTVFSKWADQHGLQVPKDYNINLKLQAWAMVYSDRGYATVHSHPNCHVSGVYYVGNDAEMPEKTMATGLQLRAGDIEFYPPGYREFQVPFMRFNESFVVPYHTGRMLAFPSYLAHMVHPMHTKGGERISIACNCTFTQTPKETK